MTLASKTLLLVLACGCTRSETVARREPPPAPTPAAPAARTPATPVLDADAQAARAVLDREKRDAARNAGILTSTALTSTGAFDPSMSAAPRRPTGKPLVYDAPALFHAFNHPDDSVDDIYARWKAGVIVTGTIERMTHEDTETRVQLVIGHQQHMSLAFADRGKAILDKSVTNGDRLTAQCQIDEASSDYWMFLTSCTLRSVKTAPDTASL